MNALNESPDRSRVTRPGAWSCLVLVLCGFAAVLRADDESELRIERLTRTNYPKFFLRYSPDGTHLAYSRHYDNRRAANKILMGLRIVKVDGTGDRSLLPEYDAQVQIQEHPAWSPDGRRLLISGGGNDTGNASKDLFVCDVDLEFRATGLRKLVAGDDDKLRYFGEEPAWSPDGRQIAYVTITEQLWVVDADGRNKTQVIQVAGQYCHQPAWSPDGKWIAFASDHEGNVELYKVRRDGTDLTRLTDASGIDCRPRWSRDARFILFSSNRGGNFDLFLMYADGSGLRPLTRHPAVDDHGDWSPDRKSIALISMRDGGFDLYQMPLPPDVVISETHPADEFDTEVPRGGLIAHFDFEGANPAAAVRNRAGRSHLELVKARTVVEEKYGALELAGPGSFATAGNAEVLRLNGPLTLSLWVRPDQSADNGYLLSKHGWNIYLGPDRVPRLETRTAANDAWDTLTATTVLPPARWSFVTAVFDTAGHRVAISVNGKLSAERARNDGAIGGVADYPLEIGHYCAGRSQNFRGRLDEIRIYNRALSADEIELEYQRQAPLVSAVKP